MVLNSPPRDLNHSSEELSAIQASRVQSSDIVPNRFFDFLCGQHSPSQMTCTMAEGYSQRHLVGDCRCTLSDISAGLVNLYDFEARARERLTEMAYAYYASGANDEITLHENHAAYDRIALRYHVLRDVSQRDLSTTVLGERVWMPILIAPMAFQGVAHPDGDIATAGAAGAAGTIMALSTLSNASIEEVAAATSAPLWFQLYVYRDRGATRDLVQRVEAAGYRALMLTVDAPVLGRREADVRNHFQLPDGLMAKNLVPADMETLPTAIADSGLASYFAFLLDPSLIWSDIEWLRSITSLPVLIKGIVRGDDAA